MRGSSWNASVTIVLALRPVSPCLGMWYVAGRPSAFDRLLALRLAHVAVASLLRGETRKMTAWMLPIPIPEEMGERSQADPGTSPLVQWRNKVFEQIEDVLII